MNRFIFDPGFHYKHAFLHHVRYFINYITLEFLIFKVQTPSPQPPIPHLYMSGR